MIGKHAEQEFKLPRIFMKDLNTIIKDTLNSNSIYCKNFKGQRFMFQMFQMFKISLRLNKWVLLLFKQISLINND